MNDFNWSDFHRFAEYLNTECSFDGHEAVQRTIISRAYYSAFCMAKEALEYKYKITFPQNAASHKYVRIEYEKRGLNHICDPLSRLRKYRNCCDYDKNVRNLHELVYQSLKLSEEIIKNL